MNPVLRTLDQELSLIVKGLSPSDLEARSLKSPASWTIDQIVRHLLLTYDSTAAAMETRLHKGYPTRSATSFQQRVARFLVLQLGWIPGGYKAPLEVNPEAVCRTSAATPKQLLQEISSALTAMDSVLERVEEHFGMARCQPHFVLGPMSAADWRRFHLVHGRHHVRQIAAIRRMSSV